MRILALDPAGKKFGIVGIQFSTVDGVQKLSIYLKHLLESPADFDSSQRTQYMSYASAAIISIDSPDKIVSESPWGMGYSKDRLVQLIGAIKAETWRKIEWQGVSEARRAVLGDGWGGADKSATAKWLLEYPWDISSKRYITAQVDAANPKTDDGYDILDAILHGLCYLVANEGLSPVVKPKKEKKRGKAKGKDQIPQ